jgi:hypothetical protein
VSWVPVVALESPPIEEIFFPSGEVHFARYGSLIGVSAKGIEYHASDHGEVFGRIVFAGS